MPANLFLIQHFHDLRLHEGRNIGVAVEDPDGRIHLRLGGLDAAGDVDTRWLRRFNLARGYYLQWRDFLERSANANDWEAVIRFQTSKPSNIIARKVGVNLSETHNWARFTDSYFAEMVDSSISERESFSDRVRRFLESAPIRFEEKVKLPGRWDNFGDTLDLEFPFGYSNRSELKVIAPIPLRHSSVYSFKASIDAVHRVNRHAVFVAVTSFDESDLDSERVETMLQPLEAGAFPINIEQENAQNTLLDVLGAA
ncbi:hypothetical protein ACLQ8T_06000 [Glutamicibacter sp. FR1]|uniref:hypothetical protein n=1 Tax=Glutamicibacter sp. FR1 TaxID=3393744 RepID=UPI0039B01F1F